MTQPRNKTALSEIRPSRKYSRNAELDDRCGRCDIFHNADDVEALALELIEKAIAGDVEAARILFAFAYGEIGEA